MMEKVLALYIPVLHEGYRLFLEQNKEAHQLFIFDQQFLRHWPNFDYLKKDIRALDSHLIKQALTPLFPNLTIVTIKNQQDWQEFLLKTKNKQWEWVLSNDDFGQYLAKEYLTGEKISFASYFLRWDRPTVKQAAHQQIASGDNGQQFKADQIISGDSFEKKIMKQAFIQANFSNDWWRQVAVVFIKNGQVLISAYNQHLPSSQEQYFNGDPRSFFSSGAAIQLTSSIHAEALAIARAASQGIALIGADLYVTTFPCPICAKQVAMTGIKRLFYSEGYAVLDGWQVLKAANIKLIQVQFNQDEKQELLAEKLKSSHLKKRYS